MTDAQAAPRVLCVHQGRELYGSDRTFLQSLRAVRRRWPRASVTALLPEGDGPLAAAVDPLADRLLREPLLVLRRRGLRPSALARLPEAARRVARARALIAEHDLTYVNTVVVADYLLAARGAGRPVVAHVHELPTGVERTLFSRLLRRAGCPIVFNSWASRYAFALPRRARCWVVHNGTAGPHPPEPPPQLPPERTMRVALVGRIGSWKGQELLIDAVGRLPARMRERVAVRMAGSGFERPRAARRLEARATRRGVRERIEIGPFVDDPGPLYRWADVVAVPSMRPEPFGLTAIEAMAHARPVIAAGHGGLAEIVVDGDGGLLFTPRSAASLAAALRAYLERPALVARHGEAARERFEQRFDEARYLQAIGSVLGHVLESG